MRRVRLTVHLGLCRIQPWEETYIEGVPLVMPGSAGEHAALQVVAEARGLQPFHRFPLWEVVDEPQGWPNLSPHSKVCEALVLMTEWLWV